MVALCGCATYVPVRHVVAPANLKVEDLPRLERVVVVMKLDPPEGPAGVLGKAVKNLARSLSDPDSASISLPRAEALSLLDDTAVALASPLSRVVAHFITNGQSATSFFDPVGATSVLWLEPSRITARQAEGEEEVYDRRQGRTVVTTVAVQKVTFSMTYRLESWPERGQLATRQFRQSAAVANATRQELAAWAKEQRGMRRTWLAGLRLDLLPIPVMHARLLVKGKSASLKSGYSAAKDGNWEGARGLWEDESRRSGDFAAFWNLGLYHERLGHWQEARDCYRHSLDGARDADDQECLNGYLAELERVYTPQASASETKAGGWFDEPVAVLPFANETTNMGAPDRVRARIQDGLRRKGYHPLPLADVTARMRNLGLTDGGQLRAFRPGDIAKAAGCRRILAGTLTDFKTVNVGLYNLHHVSVLLRLCDENGQVLWENAGVGYREILVRPQDAGRAFLGGLIESAVSKAVGQDLEEEIEIAVMTGLESLPTLPR